MAQRQGWAWGACDDLRKPGQLAKRQRDHRAGRQVGFASFSSRLHYFCDQLLFLKITTPCLLSIQSTLLK